MTRKVRFHGFSSGSTVAIAASQGGVTRGPVTVSAWKQGGSGSATLDINGYDVSSSGSLTLQGVSPLPVYAAVKSISGFATDEIGDLFIEWDFGQTYESEALNKPFIRSSINVPTKTLGVYRGPIVGHAALGTSYTSNQQTFNASCFITDGVNSLTISFDITVTDPLAYYVDTGAASYTGEFGDGAGGTLADETARFGMICVSRDGDFTGAPTGANIYHLKKADGIFDRTTFSDELNASMGASFSDPVYMTDSNTGSAATFPAGANSMDTMCIAFKTGEEYYLKSGNTGIRSPNCLWTSWPLDTATPATIESYTHRDNPSDSTEFNVGSLTNGHGARLWNVNLRGFPTGTGYLPASGSVDWWSDWAYTGKSGTFTENSANTDQGNIPPDGATITATNGAEAYLIADTGSVFRVLPINGTAPADGDTLTASSGGTATYTASGSVQREVLRNPSNGLAMGYDQGLALRVHIEDVSTGISYIGGRSVFADSSIHRNVKYGIGEWFDWRQFALVGSTLYQDRDGDTIAQPMTGNQNAWNNAIGTTVHPNNPFGCAIRINEMGKVGIALCILYNHGGAGGFDQPCTRFGTGGAASEGDIGLNLWACSISGGMRQLGLVALGGGDATTPERVPRTPAFIVVDACQILVEDTPDTIGGQYAIASDYTALWVRNCLVENPSGRTLIGGRFGGAAFQWAPNGGKEYYADPDVNWKPIKFQNNTFAYLGGTSPLADFTGLPASVTRANVIGFANTVIDVVDEDNVYIIDPAGFGTIDVPLNSDSADFNADYQPTSSATGVYQAATGSNIPREDWAGVQRPSSGASKGYREPA